MISIEEHNDKFQSFLKITKLYDDMEYYRKVQNLEKDISFFRELISRNSRSNSFNIVPALDGLYKNIYLDSKNIREIQLYLIEGFKRLSLEIDTNKYKTETPFSEKIALLDLFSEAFDKLIAAWIHRSFNSEQIDPEKGVLVIFIDDLDRCLPEKTIQVLEAIKLFLDRPGTVFVLAADENVVRAAIEAHYADQKILGQQAADYLEKIFQIRFELPPLSNAQVRSYLAENLRGLDPDLMQSLDLVITGAEANPRQIKTFLNYLSLGWSIFNNSGQTRGGEKTDFIKWLVLTRIGSSLCEKVRDLPKDSRIDFINDAVRWARDTSYKSNEYKDWEGLAHRRLRRVLQLTEFSEKLNSDLLESLIFWSAITEMPENVPGKLSKLITNRQPVAINFLSDDNWVSIPPGKFVLGSRNDNQLAEENEFPQMTYEIPYTFRISRYPVTNGEYIKYINEVGKNKIRSVEGLLNHPVINVSWFDACEYCEWLTNSARSANLISSNEIIRLPTEAEWEKAARGEYGKEWPWGNQWSSSNCNCWETGPKTTTSVDSFSPQGDSPYEVADMVGNVWEWCQSKIMPYPYRPNDGRENLDGSEKRVLRGGAFNHDHQIDRCAFRQGYDPRDSSSNIGFRLVIFKLT